MIFTPFSFSLRFILQTIYVVKTEILHLLSLKINSLYKRAVTDQEGVIVARVQCVKSKKMKLPDKTTSWKQVSEFPDYLLSQHQI